MIEYERSTALWTRNKSDELAIENGCFFDVSRGAFTVWWIERYCKLYEGEYAGQNMLLRAGCEDLYAGLDLDQDWESGGEQAAIKRAEIYSDWIAEGNYPDWQYECTMRMFGWMTCSVRYKRHIRRFNSAVIFIAKKQKKSPSLAAWGTYLTCGDGESGAKCFGGAKDGRQALIAMKHAIAMIEQSPDLAEVCKINRNENSITHIPTRSVYIPLSSSNSRTKESKEGLNGNILVDELHVVDRDFIKIISRAGISRAEPMRLEVSTAGNNPDGYGKERQDYARLVRDGAQQNDSLFVAIYEAPQDITDRELAEDPIKYGRMANPAWGHTCHESEYLADYNESKRTIAGLADFKMYRLNIWQNTANQWLRLDDWAACQDSEYQIDDFEKKRASIGMDLSKTRDMSALVAAVPVGDIVFYFPKIFTTQNFVEKHGDKTDLREWQAAGELVVIPGDTIDESFIWEEFTKFSKMLSVGVLVFDKTYAKDFTARAEKEYGSRLLLIDYPQFNSAMEKPIDDFEASVIDKKMRHPGNRCLTWQAGHAATIENVNGHRRVVKPKRNDYRKVDAMVASVMANFGCRHLPKTKSVYARRGVLCG